MATLDDTLVRESWNQMLIEGQVKEAVDVANDYIRIYVRERGILRRLFGFEPISDADLDRQHWTDKPVKIVDVEPNVEMAVSVGFFTYPDTFYLRAERIPILFNRIETPDHEKDMDEFRTYRYDLRKVATELVLRGMTDLEDIGFFNALHNVLGGAPGNPIWSGDVLWQNVGTGVTRANLTAVLSILPSASFHMPPKTALCNVDFITKIMALGRDSWGDDEAADILRNGWARTRFLGLDWEVTIKNDIVANNRLYLFGPRESVYRGYELVPPTMVVERKVPKIEFWALETIGSAITHPGAVAIADFA